MLNVTAVLPEVNYIIESEALHLSKKNKLNYDEVLSEGYQALYDVCRRFDSTKASFETYLRRTIRFKIRSWFGRQGAKHPIGKEQTFSFEEESFHPLYHYVDITEDLSDDACDAITLALSPPVWVLSKCMQLGGEKSNLQVALRMFLIRGGWSADRVADAFEEIRSAL